MISTKIQATGASTGVLQIDNGRSHSWLSLLAHMISGALLQGTSFHFLGGHRIVRSTSKDYGEMMSSSGLSPRLIDKFVALSSIPKHASFWVSVFYYSTVWTRSPGPKWAWESGKLTSSCNLPWWLPNHFSVISILFGITYCLIGETSRLNMQLWATLPGMLSKVQCAGWAWQTVEPTGIQSQRRSYCAGMGC